MTTSVGNIDTLRPDTLDRYVGQERLRRTLGIRIAAAVKQERPLGHVLLCGPPGAGKTSLASLIAQAVGDPMVSLQMPVKERVLATVVDGHRGVLFLDEIHRLKDDQEWLLPLLEFGRFHLASGKVITNPWLTVIGATTERNKVIFPLFDRFASKPVYEDYTVDHLARIAFDMAAKLDIELSLELLYAVGAAAGGVPRNVMNLMLEVRDLIVVLDREPTIIELLDQAGRTATGLTDSHMEYITALHKLGDVAGLARIKSMVRLDEAVLMDLERLLVDQNLLEFGPKGRELTDAGRRLARGTNLRAA